LDLDFDEGCHRRNARVDGQQQIGERTRGEQTRRRHDRQRVELDVLAAGLQHTHELGMSDTLRPGHRRRGQRPRWPRHRRAGTAGSDDRLQRRQAGLQWTLRAQERTTGGRGDEKGQHRHGHQGSNPLATVP
jgi:hypothetical protein